MKRKALTIGFVVLAVAAAVAIRMYVAGRPQLYRSGVAVVMGTRAQVLAVADDAGRAEEAMRAALAEIRRIDAEMSDYIEASELSQLNARASEEAVEVSEELFGLIEEAIEYSRRSGGAFDVTVGPLVDLWRRAGEEGRKPTEEELREARAKVGYDKLILDPEGRTIRFAAAGMRLDLGGIAKGYAIDRAVEALRELGMLGGMADIGGDLRCFGATPPGKEHWNIGLQHPRSSGILLTLHLGEVAVATSGDYERYVVVEGEHYSHILDPGTSRGAAALTSVTILAETATEADALATTVSVLGAEKGMALIEELPGVEAILIDPEMEITKTAGADALIGR